KEDKEWPDNSYLAKRLVKETRERGISLREEGILIPLTDLELVEDEESAYGLIFKMKEGAEGVIPLSAHNWHSIRGSGRSTAYLDVLCYLDYFNWRLDASHRTGRVVVVSEKREDTTKKFLE